MHEITSGVYALDGVRGSNVYVLAVHGGVALIDSGMPGAAATILAELTAARRWLPGSAPDGTPAVKAIVLTHGHFDHTGGAAALAAHTGAEVWAYTREVPMVEGTTPMPYPTRVQRIGLWVAEHLFGAGHAAVSRALHDGEVLPELGGLRVIHTPGHTPGSICLYRPGGDRPGGVLFTGDLLVNSPRNGQPRGLRFSIPRFSVDPAAAERSARRLLALPIDVICCGHGTPVTERGGERIRELVTRRD